MTVFAQLIQIIKLSQRKVNILKFIIQRICVFQLLKYFIIRMAFSQAQLHVNRIHLIFVKDRTLWIQLQQAINKKDVILLQFHLMALFRLPLMFAIQILKPSFNLIQKIQLSHKALSLLNSLVNQFLLINLHKQILYYNQQQLQYHYKVKRIQYLTQLEQILKWPRLCVTLIALPLRMFLAQTLHFTTNRKIILLEVNIILRLKKIHQQIGVSI